MVVLTWIVSGLLALACARRLALLAGAVLRPRPVGGRTEPTVLVVVAARDEAWQADRLLQSLAALDYPAEKIQFTLVSDGSRDLTPHIFRQWCRERAGARAIELVSNLGKAAAINAALNASPETTLLAVYDADDRPRADSLRRLAHAFFDENLAAVSGYRRPSNADHGIVSRYAALETWVHQRVVLAGKDRWSWNPPTSGSNCVYRARAIASLGGFPQGSYSEDIEASLSLAARGWRTRFLPEAVAEHRVGETLRHYANQRLRWTYGMYAAGRRARSLESVAVASNYVDRLIFATGCVLAATGWMSAGWLAGYLAAPCLQVLVALSKAGRLSQAPVFLLGALPMFLFDIGATACATTLAALRRRPEWLQTGPVAEGAPKPQA